ncbi:hypothetical protein [Nannocystis pusilla]
MRWVVLESDGKLSVIARPGADRHRDNDSPNSAGGA